MLDPLNICIVTSDLVGPIKNGGIGTAYTALARTLADAGHRVTILYTLGRFSEEGPIEDWQMAYAREGITLALLPTTDVQGAVALARAVDVYRWMKDRHFDVVHYHEWRGIGAYLAQGKRQGLCLPRAVLVAGVHSPSLWHLDGMREAPTAEDLEIDFLERQSVALADYLWSPSRYMLGWLAAAGWRRPRRQVVLPNLLADSPAPAAREAGPGTELIFFGRLETRKGLDLFCDALDRLSAAGQQSRQVTFLGKIATVDGQPSADYLRQRAAQWPWPVAIQSAMDRHQAMAYLRASGGVVVLPSRLDNVPYTVVECLAAQVPFIAADTGGIPELIAPADRARTLFALSPAALAARLTAVLTTGQRAARAAVPLASLPARWLAWHDRIVRTPATSQRARRLPHVTVCITTRNRPAFLAAALASVNRQDYPRFDVVVVDDGSDTPAALAALDRLAPELTRRGWQLIRQPNRYLGAARNRALAAARGTYVLFMDDDNLAEPDELTTFVRAAEATGADIYTCFLRGFKSAEPVPPPATPTETWPFLGAALGPGVRRNVFGDANALIRRSVFAAVGGFSEDVGVGCEDWEWFARAVLAGRRLEVVPEPLVRYRQSPAGMLQTTSRPANHLRAIRPYLATAPAALRNLVHLAAHREGAVSAPAATLDTVRTAVVFGSGEAGRRALGLARSCGWTVPWIVDNNPGMWNQTAHNLPVKPPASLSAGGFDLVIVASLAGKVPIGQQLSALGLTPGEQFVHFLDPIRVGGLTYQVAP